MSSRLAIILGSILAIVLLIGVFVYGVGYGWWISYEDAGEISGKTIPERIVTSRAADQTQAADAAGQTTAKQILFGDWHVHTTFSTDAFRMSLPSAQGEGAHPPADACDFARFCSAIDFWALTDHAEHITPRQWRESIDSIRQCNAATDPANPDVVAFLGWEWTQQGMMPEEHYGHKNVVLRGIEDNEITARPIAPGGLPTNANLFFPPPQAMRMSYFLSGLHPRYLEYAKSGVEVRGLENCPQGVNVHDLPADCRETAHTPQELFEKLDQWGVESLVIPHGTSWGMYTAPGNDWRKQLTPEMHDPERQTLIEIFSGHGNSEQYRPWRHVKYNEDGTAYCPEPSANFLPGCWRAGQIIEERCLNAGESATECSARAATARQYYIDVKSIGGYLVVPGTTSEDWLDAGQCQDCFSPTFTMRPMGTAQYMMAIRNFDVEGEPMRFDFGFIGSSDNHKARPGTGFKEFNRRQMTEAGGRPVGMMAKLRMPEPEEAKDEAREVRFSMENPQFPLYAYVESERASSFYSTGALMAVHAQGRDRDAIWNAVEKKEIYATSGPRILLWFDLTNAASDASDTPTIAPMGSHLEMRNAPEFQVKAVGAYKPKPGCPDFAGENLSEDRLEFLCRGECYNPSDERYLITRIEIVRIRPQESEDESVDTLIDDPWRVFECEANADGCTVTFSDPEFVASARDTVYYARAIQEPTQAVNADGISCKVRDESGQCLEVDICGLDEPYEEDCLSETEERAWSSPILVDNYL